MEQSNVARYRAEAEHLRQKADSTASDEVRRQILEIARQYERLADGIEKTRFSSPA